MRVTFDSNVFPLVVRPERHDKDTEASALRTINSAIKSGKIKGFAAETIANLEAIKKKDRAAYFASTSPKVSFSESVEPNGTIKLGFSIGPKENHHPGLAPILYELLNEAVGLGFRLMRCPRIGLPRAGGLDESWFADEESTEHTRKRQDKYHEALRAIEAKGVGIAIIKHLSAEISKQTGFTGPWHEALDKINDNTLMNKIAAAVAEWADSDAVAAHIGYRFDILCSRDQGKTAGRSILDQQHRAWLTNKYGVIFTTPGELALRL